MRKHRTRTIKIIKLSIFVLAMFLFNSTANAQPALEQQCSNMVQGKIAWNQAGDTSWNPANIQRLCKGTTNPSNTIACFQAQIKQHNDWDRGIKACQPTAVINPKPANNPSNRTVQSEDVQPIPLQGTSIQTHRTVTFKQNGLYQATLWVYSGYDPLDTTLWSKTVTKSVNESATINVNPKIPQNKVITIEVKMVLANPREFVIYRARTIENDPNLNFCFEAKGDLFKPYVQPCNGTKATEQKKVELKHNGSFIARASLNYLANGVAKSIPTGEVTQAVNRSFYRPLDVDDNTEIMLSVDANFFGEWNNLNEYPINFGSSSPLCYKVSGSSISLNVGNISPCSINPNARTIKFKNNGAYDARLVAYYDSPRKIKTSMLNLLGSEVQEIPRVTGSKGKTFKVIFSLDRGGANFKDFYTIQVAADFEGELCFKAEGTVANPTVSNCDDTVGDLSGSPDTRQIRFENKAGYDGQMVVAYFDKSFGTPGVSVLQSMKSVSTGFINLGKSRIVAIPKDVAPGTEIRISLFGNATVKGSNPIFTTTLPVDFSDRPMPCFKLWGSLFDPAGGKCNQ